MDTTILLSQGRSFVLEDKIDTGDAFYIDKPQEMFKSTDKVAQIYKLKVFYPDGPPCDYQLYKNGDGSWKSFHSVPDGNIDTLNEVMGKIEELGL